MPEAVPGGGGEQDAPTVDISKLLDWLSPNVLLSSLKPFSFSLFLSDSLKHQLAFYLLTVLSENSDL